MPSRAILRCNISKPTINEDRTAVLGCQLAKVNKRGVYADTEGKRHEIVATKGLIDSLLAICQESERVTGHWTHDWILEGQEGIKTTAATWRNFRKDGEGNLIADAFLFPGQNKEMILHAAENDPQSMMLSAVFDWKGDANNPTAVAVSAIDFVEKGAITESLCRAVCADADATTTPTMDITEFLTMLDDPRVKDALKSLIKSHTGPEDEVAPDAMADVTDEDKKPEDDTKTAAARAICQLSRSFTRRLKSIAIPEAKLTPEIETAIAAEVVKQVGSKKFIGAGGAETGDNFEKAITAQLAAGAPNRAAAIRRVAHDKPALYNAHLTK